MTSFTKAWNSFFFAPGSARNFGICRLLFFGWLFLAYLSWDFTGWALVDDVFHRPISIQKYFSLAVPSADVLLVLQRIWKVSLLLSCLGLFTRLSTASSFLLGLYLCTIPHSHGKIHHWDAMLLMTMAVFMFSRCGDAMSLDTLLPWGKGVDHKRYGDAGEYTWPVRMPCCILSIVMLAAGISKIKGGPDWVGPTNLSVLLMQHQYLIANTDPWVMWGAKLSTISWMCSMFALGTIVFEAGFPIALFTRWGKWVFLPGSILMFVSFRALLGPSFIEYIGSMYVFWINWDWVIGKFQKSPA